jgi:hypothetical protein
VTYIIHEGEIEFDYLEESYDENGIKQFTCYRNGEVVYSGKATSYEIRDSYEWMKKRLQEKSLL